MINFWEGKTPCWVMSRCASPVCQNCPAYRDRSLPCWEIEGTLCDQILGTPKTCDLCLVYHRYGSEGDSAGGS